ncbi:hypothetical protein [Burkholderia sola]|uniref:hypothetical protein n=1 Tax=Burkholderia sola TaxID=2843302 RepID=UPI0023DD9E82|nr:hypothetical protein [Burkholderia sola]MDF3079889.1 hypothetical protein [Burkholderia sola]
MKKLALAIAVSACAMSAYAGNPNPIDLRVQLAGEVPAQDVFEVTHTNVGSMSWDGENVKFDVPSEWSGHMEVMGGMAWKAKSSYGPIRMKLESPLQGKTPSKDKWSVLVNDSGDFIEFGASLYDSKGEEFKTIVNDPAGALVLTATEAAAGGLVMVALVGAVPGGTPHSGTYTGTVTAVFETGF